MTVDHLPALREAFGALERLALTHERPDLALAAQAASKRLAGTAVRVAVVGEFKHGKSSLLNALVDAPVCAVDDDIATAAPIEIGFAEPAGARRWYPAPDAAIESEEIAPGDAAAASTDPGTIRVRVGVPRPLLRSGLVLIDTPGVGGIGSAAAMATASALDEAHAVLFVSDASQELTRAEADALLDAAQRCPHVVLVETRIDLSPAWRTIVDADRSHLQALGLDLPIIPLSSALRLRALAAGDRALNEESGYPALVKHLVDGVLAEASALAREAAMHSARRIHAHLRAPIVREVELLESSSEHAPDVAVAAAKSELEAFRERVGRWQQLLGDGWTELVATVDTDLRDRARLLIKEAEEVVDDADPDHIWAEFEPDVYRRTAEALDANLRLLRDGATQLASQLADLLDDDEQALVSSLATDPCDDAGIAAAAALTSADDRTSGARAQQAFRAGYGGAMPIMAVGGMALGVLGLGTLVLPLAAVAGVMAGRRALTDERERRLLQRRQQAKTAVKRYVDEAVQRAQTDRKRSQRHVQRTLRDHASTRVKELLATRQRAIALAAEAASADSAARRDRLLAARAELDRIDDVARLLTRRLVDDGTPVGGGAR